LGDFVSLQKMHFFQSYAFVLHSKFFARPKNEWLGPRSKES
jgi:hypothetical protein